MGGIVLSISYQRLKSFGTWHCGFPRIVDFFWIRMFLFFHKTVSYHPCPVPVFDHCVGLVGLCLLVTGCWSPSGSQACHFGLGTDVCAILYMLFPPASIFLLDGLRGFLAQSGVFCVAVDPCRYWSGAECLWFVLLRFPGSAVSSNRRDFPVSVTLAVMP